MARRFGLGVGRRWNEPGDVLTASGTAWVDPPAGGGPFSSKVWVFEGPGGKSLPPKSPFWGKRGVLPRLAQRGKHQQPLRALRAGLVLQRPPQRAGAPPHVLQSASH